MIEVEQTAEDLAYRRSMVDIDPRAHLRLKLFVKSSKHGRVCISKKTVYASLAGNFNIPKKGEQIAFSVPFRGNKRKRVWLQVFKIVYDIKQDIFNIYLNHTHNIKHAVDYVLVDFSMKISFTETVDSFVCDYVKQWKDIVDRELSIITT